jgi:hypothetical protein
MGVNNKMDLTEREWKSVYRINEAQIGAKMEGV